MTHFENLAYTLIDRAWANSGEDLPGMVYHYTNAAGLVGMLGSKTIWATEYRFMNDASEVELGIRHSMDLIERRILREKDKKKIAFLKSLRDEMRVESSDSSYVFSLTDRRDDLSQWRGYANDGKGFTIGFDAGLIYKQSESSTVFSFGKVCYNKRTHEKKIDEAIEEFYKQLTSRNSFDTEIDACCSELESVIHSYCSGYKHSSFINENEWRINIYPFKENIKVRSSSEKLVPYVEIGEIKFGGSFPIKSIGIGPGFRSKEHIYAVEKLLHQNGLEADIYFANTPYRRD